MMKSLFNCPHALHDSIPEIKAAALLSALRTRKESAAELNGFVQALLEEAITMNK